MNNKNFPDAVIFDMDGTLWDSADAVARSWTETVSRFENAKRSFTAEDIHGVMGMTMDAISKLLFGHLEESERIAVTEACFSEECDYVAKQGGKLYENLEMTLKTLCKVTKLYIVSNCQDGYIEAFFAYHTPTMRRLTCPACGRKGLCVEVYSEPTRKENKTHE